MREVVALLNEHLPSDRVVVGSAVSERYFHIWETTQPLVALAVVIPVTTEEVSTILSICYQLGQKVVIHGGLTGLVGATKSGQDDIVLSLEKMDAIVEIDEFGKTATVESGLILEHLQKAVEKQGLFFPVSFAAEGSAQVGGMLATNAGGLRVYRYGMAREWVLGLEVVLPDGQILSSLKTIRKDNSGYDLKQLFIGSEGTLGVITQAVLKLENLPSTRQSALLSVEDYPKILELLRFLGKELKGNLSAFEVIWDTAYERLTTSPSKYAPPLPYGHPFYVLVECLGADEGYDHRVFEEAMNQVLERGMAIDAVLARTSSELERLWGIRDSVDVVVDDCNHVQLFDISLPLPSIGDYVDLLLSEFQKFPEVEKCYAYGHVADGNIHLVVGKSKESKKLREKVSQIVYGPLRALSGSVSAEHGIGLHKKEYISYTKTKEEMHLMKIVKKAIDPKSILNSGRIFDLE